MLRYLILSSAKTKSNLAQKFTNQYDILYLNHVKLGLLVCIWSFDNIQTSQNLKNAILWNVMACGSCKNRRFGGTYHLHYQDEKNQRAGNVCSNFILSSLIPLTLMREDIYSSETSVLMRDTLRHIREDGILHSHRRQDLKSYIALMDWIL
jgi:hypothetical protein